VINPYISIEQGDIKQRGRFMYIFQVDEWVKNLDLFGKVLEEWLVCQKKWIHLEAIFTAPIIQQKLPHEFGLFNIVDKWYRNLMRGVHKNSLAFINMTNTQHLENFKQNIMLMEQVFRCLEMHLESKRIAFPRFYFLSNFELFEIFVKARNPHDIQPLLKKCFEGISKIEFGTKRDDNKKEIISTNDILAMYSIEGERVQFIKV
jgi:dynein heavy chain